MSQMKIKLALLYAQWSLNLLVLRLCQLAFVLFRTRSAVLLYLVLILSFNPHQVCSAQAPDPPPVTVKLREFENGVSADELNKTIKISLGNRSSGEIYEGNHQIFCSTTPTITETSFQYHTITGITLAPDEEQAYDFRIPQNLEAGKYYLQVVNEKQHIVSVVEIQVKQNGNVLILPKESTPTWPYLLAALALGFGAFQLYRRRSGSSVQNQQPSSFSDLECLVITGKLEKALGILHRRAQTRDEELSNEIVLLQAELNRFSKERLNGLIREEDYTTSRNRLMLRTLHLGKELTIA